MPKKNLAQEAARKQSAAVAAPTSAVAVKTSTPTQTKAVAVSKDSPIAEHWSAMMRLAQEDPNRYVPEIVAGFRSLVMALREKQGAQQSAQNPPPQAATAPPGTPAGAASVPPPGSASPRPAMAA